MIPIGNHPSDIFTGKHCCNRLNCTRKLTYQNMISMYELYDLTEPEDEERDAQ